MNKLIQNRLSANSLLGLVFKGLLFLTDKLNVHFVNGAFWICLSIEWFADFHLRIVKTFKIFIVNLKATQPIYFAYVSQANFGFVEGRSLPYDIGKHMTFD